MNKVLSQLGLVSGIAGMLLCGVPGVARLLGHSYLFGLESATLFLAGIGLLATGSFLKLYSIDA